MANLRRHFNFSTKSSVQQEMPFSTSNSNKTPNFDKHILMNDICNCLDLCCTYIQALNSLCGAGALLAKNLFHAVQDVPAYHNISQQFVSIWEEVGKATAGASAAVKTETLMMLQEIFNTLEMETSEANINDTLTESFQVIGTCLCSFIELQAQFSLSTWKSLSKLSKSFSSDSLRHTLQWKSHDRSPLKISVNSHLNATIKKHFSQLFCKVGISKVNEPNDDTQSHFYTTPSLQGQREITEYSQFIPQTVANNTSLETCVWSPSTSFWSSSNSMIPHSSSSSNISAQDAQGKVKDTHSELDKVINLLSCVPAQSFLEDKVNNPNENYLPYHSKNEPSYNFWPKGSMLPISKHINSHRSWTKDSQDITFGYDSWIWRIDNMNCCGLPDGSTLINVQNNNNQSQIPQECKDLPKWNNGVCETGSSSDDASSGHGQDVESLGPTNLFNKDLISSFKQRWHISGESLPGGLENEIESRNEDVRSSKISTWPLKQPSYKNIENGFDEKQLHFKYMPFYFTP